MSTSALPHEPIVCNTTPVRIFAIVGQFDLLASALGGTVRVPRQVFDPDDAPGAPPGLLSEIGRSERFFHERSPDDDARDSWSRLAELRARDDIEAIDLDDSELQLYATLSGRGAARQHDLAAPLGSGEAAVMAVAETRRWGAAIDDAEARRVLSARAPGITTITSRELLLRAVGQELIDSGGAQLIYSDMLEKHYRGPENLF